MKRVNGQESSRLHRSLPVLVPVVFLFVLLGLLILFGSSNYSRDRINRMVSYGNIEEQLEIALEFSKMNDGQFPTAAEWPGEFIKAEIDGRNIWVSYAEEGDGVSFIYLGGKSTLDPFQIVIYEDPKHYDDVVFVGFADGHVEQLDHATFERMLAEQLQE